MSLGRLNSSSSDKSIRLRSKPDISSDIVIKKPSVLAGKCRPQNQSKRFPVIDNAAEMKKPPKKSISSSESSEFWLKPGISLPKLHSKNASQEKVEAGEFFPSFSYSNLPKKKADYEFDEIQPTDSKKCFQIKSESFEVCPDVVGPSQCKVSFRVPSSELNLDKLQAEEEPIKEDNALKHWRKWIQRHKKQQNYLGKHLKKNAVNLVFQRTHMYRQAFENTQLLVNNDIPRADKWRGHPFRWLSSIEMGGKKRKSHKSQDVDSLPAYFLQKTLAQQGIETDLEFIGIPEVIMKEKGLESPQRFDFTLLRSNLKVNSLAAAAEERIQIFLKSRDRLKPSIEDFNVMAIVGKKILRTPEEVIPDPPVNNDLPMIEVTSPDNEIPCQEILKSVFCLVINGLEVKYDLGQANENESEGNSHCTWELDFGVNEFGKRVEKTLLIENKGTLAVRYKWVSKDMEQRQKLNMSVPKQHEPWFFFNKNSGIFLPGQLYNLKFYYHARKSGVRTETWYMKTTPPFNKNTGYGTIILSAVTSGDAQYLKSCVLEKYLKERLRDSIVKFILNILFEKVTSLDENLHELEYQSLFFDKELFEYHNPKYYYHSEMVKELQELFEKIPFKTQNRWDLSLDSLKKLISINTKGKDRENLMCNLCKVAKTLLKPNRVFSKRENKYTMAYNILCKMSNFMEADYDCLRSIMFSRKRQIENAWGYGEDEETVICMSLTSEEKSDLDSGSSGSIFEIKPINLIYFQTMFYIKVYHRVSEAVENIVGMLESNKKFESSGNVNYGLSKPLKTNEYDFFPCN